MADALSKQIDILYRQKGKLALADTLVRVSDWDWDDFVFRLDENAELFRLFFIKTTPDMIDKTTRIETRIETAVNKYGRVLYLAIKNPERTMACHFWQTPGMVDGKRPLQMSCKHFKVDDILDIYFVDPVHLPTDLESTDEVYQDTLVGEDANGRILKITILNASRVLAKQKRDRKSVV